MNWDVHREEGQEAENTISYLIVMILPSSEKAVSGKHMEYGSCCSSVPFEGYTCKDARG